MPHEDEIGLTDALDIVDAMERPYEGAYLMARVTDAYQLWAAAIRWLAEHPNDDNAHFVRESCERVNKAINADMEWKRRP